MMRRAFIPTLTLTTIFSCLTLATIIMASSASLMCQTQALLPAIDRVHLQLELAGEGRQPPETS